MKRLFFLLSICFLLLSCNQENIVAIAGEFKNMENVLVALTLDNKVLKTNTIKNGKFEMLVKLPNNRLIGLSFKDTVLKKTAKGLLLRNWPHINLFTDDKETKITVVADSIEGLLHFGNYKILGRSKSQIDYENYQSLLKKDRAVNQAKFKALSKKQDEALWAKNDSLFTLYTDSLRFQENLGKTTHNIVIRNFIANNPNSYVSMYLLSKRSDLKSNLAFYQLLYNKANSTYRKSWYGLYFAKRVEQLEKLKEKYIRKLAVNAFNVNGKGFNYREYGDSKLIVFDIWATWCVPCMEDMPAALKLAKELEDKSVSYVFLSYDFNDKHWKQQSKKIGLKNSYYLSNETRKFLNEELVITTIPRYMILNQKGEILVLDAPAPSSPELKKLIESML